jgi:uncharacterized protein (TIGR00251 family)
MAAAIAGRSAPTAVAANHTARSWYRWDGDALILQLRIQPGARRDEFAGPYGEHQYRLRIAAPALEGRANLQLRRFLAKRFGVATSGVAIVGGEHGRDKVIRITRPSRSPLAEIGVA